MDDRARSGCSHDQGGVATSGQILSYHHQARIRSAAEYRCAGTALARDLLPGDSRRTSCGCVGWTCHAASGLRPASAQRRPGYGFDTEEPDELHVLNPPGSRTAIVPTAWWCTVATARRWSMRRRASRHRAGVDGGRGRAHPAPSAGSGDPGRRAAQRHLQPRRPMARRARAEAGRRGIVAVRDLLPLADGRAESPMESEARLAMIDGGLPIPELQYEVIDGNGELRRLDFAWPDERVAVEYDGVTGTAARRDARDRGAQRAAGRRLDGRADRVRGCPLPRVGLRRPDRCAVASRSSGVSAARNASVRGVSAYRHAARGTHELRPGCRGRCCAPGGSADRARIRLAHRRFRPPRPSRRGSAPTGGRPPRRRPRTARPAPGRCRCPTTRGPPGTGSSCGCRARSPPSGRGSPRRPWSCRRARRTPCDVGSSTTVASAPSQPMSSPPNVRRQPCSQPVPAIGECGARCSICSGCMFDP